MSQPITNSDTEQPIRQTPEGQLLMLQESERSEPSSVPVFVSERPIKTGIILY